MSSAPTAMVTGASRGIGRAIALALAADGYDVAITARTVDEGTGPGGLPGSLTATAAQIESAGRRALPIRLDLLERGALEPAIETVLDAFGHVDVLVNNAIYATSHRRFLEMDAAEIDDRIFANLTAQLVLSHRALRAMAERGRGVVINLISGAGLGDPTRPVGEGGWQLTYGCAKGGLVRMAGVVAVELGDHGIRCYNLEPGWVATERVRTDPRLADVAARGKPPQTIGAVVTWLLRQPDGTVPNGGTIDATAVARELGLLAGAPTTQRP